MDVPLALWAIQQDRETEIARLQLAATAVRQPARGAGLSPSASAESPGRRVARAFASVFAWARQIRSLVS